MSIEHILGYIGCLRSDAINNRTAFANATLSESKSNTICVVGERPNHRCRDDLVSALHIFMLSSIISHAVNSAVNSVN